MSKFWKLWGSLAGCFAGVIVGAAVGAGFGECSDVTQIATCTVAGFSTAQITTALTVIGGALGTYIAPANS
jgi:hypothetical protein